MGPVRAPLGPARCEERQCARSASRATDLPGLASAIGNRRFTQLVCERKLARQPITVGAADDASEREADRVALGLARPTARRAARGDGRREPRVPGSRRQRVALAHRRQLGRHRHQPPGHRRERQGAGGHRLPRALTRAGVPRDQGGGLEEGRVRRAAADQLCDQGQRGHPRDPQALAGARPSARLFRLRHRHAGVAVHTVRAADGDRRPPGDARVVPAGRDRVQDPRRRQQGPPLLRDLGQGPHRSVHRRHAHPGGGHGRQGAGAAPGRAVAGAGEPQAAPGQGARAPAQRHPRPASGAAHRGVAAALELTAAEVLAALRQRLRGQGLLDLLLSRMHPHGDVIPLPIAEAAAKTASVLMFALILDMAMALVFTL